MIDFEKIYNGEIRTFGSLLASDLCDDSLEDECDSIPDNSYYFRKLKTLINLPDADFKKCCLDKLQWELDECIRQLEDLSLCIKNLNRLINDACNHNLTEYSKDVLEILEQNCLKCSEQYNTVQEQAKEYLDKIENFDVETKRKELKEIIKLYIQFGI